MTLEELAAGATKPPSPAGARVAAVRPPAHAPGSSPWPTPVPLPTLAAVPAFPLDALPAKVADYYAACAASLNAPVDYVAVPGLGLLGAAVGRSRTVEVKPGYRELPCLWTAVVAPPGSKKSAALKAAAAPLHAAEKRWRKEHKAAAQAFEADRDRHAARHSQWKKDGCDGDPPDTPAGPVLRQIVLDDATVEALVRVLKDNPRGVAFYKDELSGFVAGMNQYRGGQGADRQFHLSCWAGAPAKTSRAKDHAGGPVVVPEPFESINGMLCPDSLPALRGEDRQGAAPADGWADRFLFSYPDPVPDCGETWTTVPPEMRDGYAGVVDALLAVDLIQAGDDGEDRRPLVVVLDDAARAEWGRFTSAVAAKANALDPDDPFRGVLSKLKGYAARLAVLLYAVRRACGELAHGDPLDAETLGRAVRLVDYFEAHAGRCLGVGVSGAAGRVARRLVAWLDRHPDKVAFTRSEAYIALKDRRDVRESRSLDPALRLASDHGYVRPAAPADASGRPGPAPEVYEVNPAWGRPTGTSRQGTPRTADL